MNDHIAIALLVSGLAVGAVAAAGTAPVIMYLRRHWSPLAVFLWASTCALVVIWIVQTYLNGVSVAELRQSWLLDVPVSQLPLDAGEAPTPGSFFDPIGYFLAALAAGASAALTAAAVEIPDSQTSRGYLAPRSVRQQDATHDKRPVQAA